MMRLIIFDSAQRPCRPALIGLVLLMLCLHASANDAVQSLIEDLKSNNLEVNRNAMAELIKVGLPAVGGLIACLRDSDELPRISAAEALGRIGDPRAVPPLMDLFADDNYAVRWAVAEALGRIGDPRAVDLLINGLRNASPDLRGAIVMALNKIGDPRAVPPLAEFLKDENPDVRVSAARVVGRLGGTEVIPAIMPCLNDGNAHVRLAAAEALGRLSAVPAVDALILMLNDKSDAVRRAAAAALGNIGDPRGVTPLTIALQEYDADQRIAIAGALGALRDPSGAAPVIELLRDERAEVREAAVAALAQMGSAAGPGLVACLGDYNTQISSTAAELLGQIGHPDARDPLIPLLTHPKKSVRSAAAGALKNIGYQPESLDDKIDFYIAGGNWDAIHALGGAASEALLARLQSRDATERILTLAALEHVGRRDISPLVDALSRTNTSVRLFAAEALGRIGDENAIEPLTEVMQNDSSEYVRKYAARALNQLGREVPIPEIAPIRIERSAAAESDSEDTADAGESAAQPESSSATSNILGDLPLLSF